MPTAMSMHTDSMRVRLMKKLLFLFLLPIPLFGQTRNVGRTMNGTFAQRPVCSVTLADTNAHNGDIWNDLDDANIYKCNAGVWTLVGSGGGGSIVQNPLTTGGLSNSAFPFQISGDVQSCGPNPWVDVRCYGAVPVSVAPGTSTTVNITGGTAVATISSASTWVNGMGLTIPHAGPAPTMSTPGAPAVTAMQSSAGTGTGLGVAATGSTTYQYQISGVDLQRGITIASSATVIANGNATLGQRSATASTHSRSGNTVTVTMAAPTEIAAGAMLSINGTSDDLNFGGWPIVASVIDSTHFTYASNTYASGYSDSSGLSATGGTVIWFNFNEIKISAPGAGVWQYIIFGNQSGSMTRLGITPPVNAALSGDSTYLVWDDFGGSMGIPPTLPSFYPTVPPVAVANQNLTTTILSGAGTTTLTLAATATNTVSAGPILFDDGPGLIAAATVAMAFSNGGGMVYIAAPPTNGSPQNYIINSYTKLPVAHTGVSLAAPLLLNDTLDLNGAQLFGNLTINGGQMGFPAFASESYSVINVNTAYPGVYSKVDTNIRGILFQGYAGLTPNALLEVNDTPGAVPSSQWTDCAWFTSSGSNDYLGIGLLARGVVLNSDSGMQFKNTLWIGPVSTNATATPILYINQGSADFLTTFLNYRSIMVRGGPFTTTRSYRQSGASPTYMAVNVFSGGDIYMQSIFSDTDIQPIIAGWGTGAPSLRISGANGITPGKPLITGNPFPVISVDDTGPASSPANFNSKSSTNFGFISLPNFGLNLFGFDVQQRPLIFNGNPANNAIWPVVAPTAVTSNVAAGGAIPVSPPVLYRVTAVGFDGGESQPSPPGTACAVSSGNQSCVISWTPTPIGSQCSTVYRSVANGGYGRVIGGTCVSPPITDNSFGTSNGSMPAAGGGGIVAVGYDSNANPMVLTPELIMPPRTAPTTIAGPTYLYTSSATGALTSSNSIATGAGASGCGAVTGCLAIGEGSSAAPGAAGADTIRADSVSHSLKCTYNGGAETGCSSGGGSAVPTFWADSNNRGQLWQTTADGTNSSFFSLGEVQTTSGTITGTNSLTAADPTYYNSVLSAASSGAFAGINGNKSCLWQKDCWIQMQVNVDAATPAAERSEFGLGQTTSIIATNDTCNSLSCVVFRASSTASDTNFQCVTSTGSVSNVVSTGVAIDTNRHVLEIRSSGGGTSVSFFIDGVSVCSSPITTNLPASGTSMATVVGVLTTTTTAKTVHIAKVGVSAIVH
jgi:hypothetical protein